MTGLEQTAPWCGKGGAAWRAALYLLLAAVLTMALAEACAHLPLPRYLPGAPFTPVFIASNEALLLLPVLAASWVMTRIEGRGLLSCGLIGPGGRGLARGFAVGAALVGALTLLLLVLGAGRATWGGLGPGPALGYALAWAAVSLFIGLAEELAFRGFLLQTLASGFGDIPAIAFTSLLFGAMHITNTGEGLTGAAAAALGGAVMAVSVRRTGALWWAIGFHGGWDYAENFLAGTPDSGQLCAGALFRVVPHGPVWLSGGATGPEGSVLSLLILGGVFLAAWRFFPPHIQNSDKAIY